MEPTNDLQELLDLTKENNRLLKAMRRDALIGGIVKMLIWIALIGGSFYFSMQFLTPYLSMLENVQEGSRGMNFDALLEQYRALYGNE